MDALRRGVEIGSGNLELRDPLARVLFGQAWAKFDGGMDEKLKKTLTAAETYHPQMSAFPMLRGDYLMRAGRCREAIAQYEKAIAIDGDRVGPDAEPKLAEARKQCP